MAIINYSDLTGQSMRGHADEKVDLHDGYILVERVGYARITSTLQTNIPVFLPSSANSALELTTNPDKRLTLPVGAVVTNVALRLPRLESDLSTPQFGNLQRGATLIGITTDRVKVAADNTFTTTVPSVVCTANIYTPNDSNTVSRSIAAPADIASSLVATVVAATSVSVVVSNASNTAAGTGIRTSAGEAFAIVRICYLEPKPASTYEDMMQFVQRGRI